MGEELSLFRAELNGSLRIEAREERLTGDAGSIVLREVLEWLGMSRWMTEKLRDQRNQDLITHPLAELLHTSLLLLAQGWRGHDDADTLRDDPALRLAVSERRGVGPLLAAEEERTPEGQSLAADSCAKHSWNSQRDGSRRPTGRRSRA